ncbi:MAG: sensor histidine kinase [Coriobacteriia bacterium]|nr:sensor histidine kinase [Coriobacteriia bacterium]
MNTSRRFSWGSLSATARDSIGAVTGAVVSATFLMLRAPIVIRGGGFGGGDPGAEQFKTQGAETLRLARPELSPWAVVLSAIAFLPLAYRRRFPLAVLAVVTGITAANDLIPGPPSLVFLAPLIALYTVGTERSRKTLVAAACLTATAQLAISLPHYTSTTFWADAVRIISMVAVAAALGDATRNRRAYVAEVEQRAVEAERTRDEEARRRVDEERLRIARELHDVTAHSLSIIAVQSGAAAHVIDTNPAEARRSLDAIRRTSKEALDELRAMLGVLRSEDDAGAPLAPTPGLARLGDLAAPMRDAGVEVALDVAESLDELPALVDASAYRIVQEALTNVVRHAGPCAVTVRVRRVGDDLTIEVADSGVGASAEVSAGHGLAGMRERALALGGTFEAGPRSEGGFRVAAMLPITSRGGRA